MKFLLFLMATAMGSGLLADTDKCEVTNLPGSGAIVKVNNYPVATFEPSRNDPGVSRTKARELVEVLRSHGACLGQNNVCGFKSGEKSTGFKGSDADIILTLNRTELVAFQGTKENYAETYNRALALLSKYFDAGVCDRDVILLEGIKF